MGIEVNGERIDRIMMYYGLFFIEEVDFFFNDYFTKLEIFFGSIVFEIIIFWMENMLEGKWFNWMVSFYV